MEGEGRGGCSCGGQKKCMRDRVLGSGGWREWRVLWSVEGWSGAHRKLDGSSWCGVVHR